MKTTDIKYEIPPWIILPSIDGIIREMIVVSHANNNDHLYFWVDRKEFGGDVNPIEYQLVVNILDEITGVENWIATLEFDRFWLVNEAVENIINGRLVYRGLEKLGGAI